jgi:predicted component of type VI protein secretion system
MKFLKNTVVITLCCAALAACSSSKPASEAKLSLLTADQTAVLGGTASENVVRDDVDGGKVATL